MIILSIIIPAYNAQQSLELCLMAVASALKDNMEVIIVDDCSSDNTSLIAEQFPYKVVRMDKNSGPGAARNMGAENAKGEYLLFLDADVIVHINTFTELIKTLKARPEISGVSAAYSDNPVLPGLFQEFKAVEQTYYSSFYSSNQYSGFDTHCGVIKRSVFFEMGGFSVSYRKADVEDMEFGYRIENKYINCINTDIVVDHLYATYLKNLQNYMRRSFLWVKLFLSRIKFDQAVTTKSNAISVLLSGVAIFFLFFALWHHSFIYLSGSIFILYILFNFRFFLIVAKKAKYIALIKGFIFLYFLFTLQIAVALGATAGFVFWPLRSLIRFLGNICHKNKIKIRY